MEHPERIACVVIFGRRPLCWECYLGHEEFLLKFGPDDAERFYQPGGPGYAGES